MRFVGGAVLLVLVWQVADAGHSRGKHLRLEPDGDYHAYFTGDAFFVTCIPDMMSRATRLTWQTPDGKEIVTTRGRVHVEPSRNNILGLELVVEEARQKDQGMFKCTAVVDGRETTIQFYLRVYLSITFSDTSEEQIGREGSNFMIMCHVRSDPLPIVSWYVNGSIVLDGPRRTLSEDGLFVRNLKTTDAGNYVCRALVVTPEKSQIQDKNIAVHVHYKPVWTNEVDTFYSVLESTGSLTCESKSEPNPTFEWFKGSSLLGNSKIYKIKNEKYRSTLQVKIINYSNFGTYLCLVSNNVGEIQKDMFLLEGVPPNVPSFSLSSNEPGVLEVNIQQPLQDDLPITGYTIQWKQFDVPWKNAKEYLTSKGTEFMFHDLSLDTNYSVRVRAQNDIGLSNYTEPQTQRTQGLVAETVVDNSKVLSSTFSGTSSRSSILITGVASFMITAVSWVIRHWTMIS
ncbi:hypothetical protein JTE90_025028 [Oedothorax gibbosus]|uniref:Uncharacterized protein n=1 Tax=Oedothorax gibbosus TaxID=931172 RepID=A0AAV6TXA7_9ARAC|nr:hypothetical protein JTE90_025028 [Oedothorax gibbosus]